MIKQLFLVIILGLAPPLWSSANAQLPPGAGSGSRKDKSVEDKYRSDEMERIRREGHKPGNRATTRFPQIKEDFERIQVINSNVLQALGPAVDYQHLSDAVAEIKKRATRLKSNLFPADSKDHAEQAQQETKVGQDLKSLLTALDKTITSFVHNPIFQNTKVVDPQDSERAEKELAKIIHLSARTRKATRIKR